jgi:hypothetical protein
VYTAGPTGESGSVNDQNKLARATVRLVGSLVEQAGFSDKASAVVDCLTHVVDAYYQQGVMKDSLELSIVLEALNGIQKAISVSPVELYQEQDHIAAWVGDFVERVLTDQDGESEMVKSVFVAAMKAHPYVVLCRLNNVMKSSRHGKVCFLAAMGHGYIVSEYEKDISLPSLGLTSVLERAIDNFNGLMMADCQRLVQSIMVLVSLSSEEEKRVHEVVSRMTGKILSKKHAAIVSTDEMNQDIQDIVEKQEHGAIPDFEEGELLDSVYKSASKNANRNVQDSIEGIVPRRICQSLVVEGIPESADLDEIRRMCDKFSGVKGVSRDAQSAVHVVCTSMPGAVRCFEAMYTRGIKFWSCSEDLIETPVVSFADSESDVPGCFLLMAGVEHVEQEDKIKEVLKKASCNLPQSLIPINTNVQGVILCFEKDLDARKAYTSLGGVEETNSKRQREVADPEGRAAKKERWDVGDSRSKNDIQWTGEILRNKQSQCFVVARPLLNSRFSFDPEDQVSWPRALEVNQRADVKYLQQTLFVSKQVQVTSLTYMYPSRPEDASGLQSFNQYLLGKGRAGVVFLPSSSRGQQTLYLMPLTDNLCYDLGINKNQFVEPCTIGITVNK